MEFKCNNCGSNMLAEVATCEQVFLPVKADWNHRGDFVVLPAEDGREPVFHGSCSIEQYCCGGCGQTLEGVTTWDELEEWMELNGCPVS